MVSDAEPVDGRWYAPHAGHAVPARLRLDADGVLIAEDALGAVLARQPLSTTDITDRIGSIPRRATFADGSAFETRDNDAMDRLLKPHRGPGFGAVHGLERFRPRLALFVVLVVALALGLYRFAMPALVEVAVWATPPVVPQILSRSALASLDASVLDDSALPKQRRDDITAGFRQLAAITPRGAEGYTLHFRRGGTLGPNAFALPNGSIVLTDELVELGGDGDTVLGVLAHEIGHVEHEHSLRRLYRAVGVTGLVMLIGGDIGAGAEDMLMQGAALTTLSYSRDQEREADRFSVDLMHRSGGDPMAISRFFELLRDHFGEGGSDSFLSTHPATAERIAETRRLAQEAMRAR